uniref:Stage 0 sporulation protein A homolog n=1 Tax=Gayliella sp. TaxID=2575623 RepID=A0A4D6WU76_9FLOR|nr:hypothetical protein [Gayliella sp.]
MNNLLIVDDDIYVRNSIEVFLKNEKFNVISLQDVYSVLLYLKENLVDLIIIDIVMPELDGYDLLKILRSQLVYSCIPCILLTAKGLTVDKIKGYNLGCNVYITKPFDPYELLSIVKNLLHFNINTCFDDISVDSLISSNDFILSLFTEREKSVLNLVLQGYTNKEIGITLQLSIRSIEKYVSKLLDKTNSRNRTELVNYIFSRANDGNRTRE